MNVEPCVFVLPSITNLISVITLPRPAVVVFLKSKAGLTVLRETLFQNIIKFVTTCFQFSTNGFANIAKHLMTYPSYVFGQMMN